MKNIYKNKLIIFIVACFAFGAGFFIDRSIDIINRADLVEYFQNYGEKIVYFNDILDEVQIESPLLRENINKAFLKDLICSPMGYYYLPKAIEAGEDDLDEFWEGYLEAHKYANLNENETTESHFDCP